MEKGGMAFPLHRCVTEAGDGEDGRIKSAAGIGALLADGYGDTIRVSLSEAPELEIPVARKLTGHFAAIAGHPVIAGPENPDYDPIRIVRRKSHDTEITGGNHVPVVIADYSKGESVPATDSLIDPDYVYIGMRDPKPFGTRRLIADRKNPYAETTISRLYRATEREQAEKDTNTVKFMTVSLEELHQDLSLTEWLKCHPEVIVLTDNRNPNRTGEQRALIFTLDAAGITNPVILHNRYAEDSAEDLQVKAGADYGANLIDQLADGIMLTNRGALTPEQITGIMFGLLQATRLRISKTEYISCPGCGRTLFDLQSTIARVKEATSHLTGLKIGIMGCIVNGPGEMADADYGYVGAGRGRVSLYKNKTCLEKNIPEEEAVEKLIELIKAHGDWKEQ